MTIDASKPALAALTTWAALTASSALGQCVYETAHLIPPDGAQDDRFGIGLALNGDTLAAGATQQDEFGANKGAVYVFRRIDGAWALESKFAPDGIDAGSGFGRSVALQNGTLVVGAISDDVVGTVHVFEASEDGWMLAGKLEAPDLGAGDRFGVGVDLDGDTLIVGAQRHDALGSDSGAVFVFEREGDGQWAFVQKLLASDGQAGDQFGQYVSLRADRLLAGAKWEDERGTNAGAAYNFRRVDGTWIEEAKLTAPDGEADDQFGHSVYLGQTWAAVGASSADGPAPDSGAVYLFRMEGDVWAFQQKLTASDGATGDAFGQDVNVVGDTAIVSAPNADAYGADAGAAYVFKLDESSMTWQETGKFVGSMVEPGDRFGAFESQGIAFDGQHAAITAGLGEANGVPDVGAVYTFSLSQPGECYPDFFPDCTLDIIDFVAFQNAYLIGQPEADCNGDGLLNILDFVCFQGQFQAGCP